MGFRERLTRALSQGEAHSKGESVKRGKTLREIVPRESHAEWAPPTDRPDPVELLRSQGEARVVMRQCGVCLVILGLAVATLMYLYVIGHELMELSVGLAWALTILVAAAVLVVFGVGLLMRANKVEDVAM